jgi:hypothetical protein
LKPQEIQVFLEHLKEQLADMERLKISIDE